MFRKFGRFRKLYWLPRTGSWQCIWADQLKLLTRKLYCEENCDVATLAGSSMGEAVDKKVFRTNFQTSVAELNLLNSAVEHTLDLTRVRIELKSS